MPDKQPSPADDPQSSKISVEALFSRLGDVQRRLDELPTEEVDKSRRDLLIASTIGGVVSLTGAVPTKIQAVGVEFTKVEQRYFFIFIGLVVSYFLFKVWLKYTQQRVRWYALSGEVWSLMHRIGEQRQHILAPGMPNPSLYESLLRIEVWLPIFLGIVSIILSFYAAIVGQSVAQQGIPLPGLSSPNS
jgi:hypothetical protein